MKKSEREIHIKRVYEPATRTDGKRFLVDRLWPRGVKKESLKLDGWLKDLAPGDELRKWFQHEPAKWNEFEKRYCAELNRSPEKWEHLLNLAKNETVTLLFSARDVEHNNAVVLKKFLSGKLTR